MMEGKYDDECSMVRELTGAVATLVIIFGGTKGEGFSMQLDASRSNPDFVRKVPDILRNVASGIEQQLKEGRVVVELKPSRDETRK